MKALHSHFIALHNTSKYVLTQQCTENHLQLVTTTFTQSAREKGVDFEFHVLEDADFMCVVSDLIERFVWLPRGKCSFSISHSSSYRP